MTKLVFDERFGTMSFAQRAAYRKYNVSQSDHDMLTEVIREDAHADLTQIVKDYSPGGSFDVFAALRDLRRGQAYAQWELQRR